MRECKVNVRACVRVRVVCERESGRREADLVEEVVLLGDVIQDVKNHLVVANESDLTRGPVGTDHMGVCVVPVGSEICSVRKRKRRRADGEGEGEGREITK